MWSCDALLLVIYLSPLKSFSVIGPQSDSYGVIFLSSFPTTDHLTNVCSLDSTEPAILYLTFHHRFLTLRGSKQGSLDHSPTSAKELASIIQPIMVTGFSPQAGWKHLPTAHRKVWREYDWSTGGEQRIEHEGHVFGGSQVSRRGR